LSNISEAGIAEALSAGVIVHRGRACLASVRVKPRRLTGPAFTGAAFPGAVEAEFAEVVFLMEDVQLGGDALAPVRLAGGMHVAQAASLEGGKVDFLATLLVEVVEVGFVGAL
jgi:hypothetical protein